MRAQLRTYARKHPRHGFRRAWAALRASWWVTASSHAPPSRKAASAAIRAELTERVAELKSKGITPGIATVLVGADPASQLYVGMKHRQSEAIGMNSIQVELPADATQADVEAEIDRLNADETCHGYIVQLPLPRHLDTDRILERIDPAKDADGLHPVNLGKLVLNVNDEITSPLPCTPRAVIELLERNGFALAGTHVVVVGRGVTIGRSIGLLLTRREINATVTGGLATTDPVLIARKNGVMVLMSIELILNAVNINLVAFSAMTGAVSGQVFALFVIASGITLLQVAANPLVAELGSKKSSHFRLVFSQAFNSLGATVGPWLGAHVLLTGGVFAAGAVVTAATRGVPGFNYLLAGSDFNVVLNALLYEIDMRETALTTSSRKREH